MCASARLVARSAMLVLVPLQSRPRLSPAAAAAERLTGVGRSLAAASEPAGVLCSPTSPGCAPSRCARVT